MAAAVFRIEPWGYFGMASVVDECGNLKLSLAIELLRSVGEARLAVGGGSMLPCLWPGDIVAVHRVAAHDLLPGDIVVFARENRLVVHRVLRLNRDQEEISVTTCGDRVSKVDSPVSTDELLGKVKHIQRGTRSLDPRMTTWTRIAARVLRRSEFCTRVLLYVAMILPRSFQRTSLRSTSLTPETAWAR